MAHLREDKCKFSPRQWYVKTHRQATLQMFIDSDEEDEESDQNTNPANPKIKMAFNKKR